MNNFFVLRDTHIRNFQISNGNKKKSVNCRLKTASDRLSSLWLNLNDEYKVRRIKNAEVLFVNYTTDTIKILGIFKIKLLFQL